MQSLNSVNGVRLAGWFPRLCAHAVDAWVVPLIVLAYVVPSLIRAAFAYVKDWIQFQSSSAVTFGKLHTQPPVFNNDDIVSSWMWLLVVAWVGLVLLNSIVWQGLTGHSLGKRLFRIRTVHGDHGRPSGIPRSAWRWVLQRVNLFLPGALLVPLSDPYRRSIADKFANTVVVGDPHGLPRNRSSWRSHATPPPLTVDVRESPRPHAQTARPVDMRRAPRR